MSNNATCVAAQSGGIGQFGLVDTVMLFRSMSVKCGSQLGNRSACACLVWRGITQPLELVYKE
jgi:hypothetical protein